MFIGLSILFFNCFPSLKMDPACLSGDYYFFLRVKVLAIREVELWIFPCLSKVSGENAYEV